MNFQKLTENDRVLAAFNGAVENHYRYYQCYSNSVVAVILAGVIALYFSDLSLAALMTAGISLAVLVIELLLAANHAYTRYVERTRQILS